jgi:hypothetical protein
MYRDTIRFSTVNIVFLVSRKRECNEVLESDWNIHIGFKGDKAKNRPSLALHEPVGSSKETSVKIQSFANLAKVCYWWF